MNVSGVLLAPGAGSDRDHHTLVALERGLAPMHVERIDFPYRKAGRKAPDRAPKLVEAVRNETEQLAAHLGCQSADLVIGGRSMGGRMCSMAVSDGLPAAGLVLISYPLHPPGKPEALRTDHFPVVTVPVLFVHGTRDPFGSPEELALASHAIAGPVSHIWVEGGRHDLAGSDDVIVSAIRNWLAS
jgi:predicted alpha/beta-hydrolase family hydrolase